MNSKFFGAGLTCLTRFARQPFAGQTVLSKGRLPRAAGCWRLLKAGFGCWLLLSGPDAAGQQLPISAARYHLRNGETAEWSSFAGKPHGRQLQLNFQAQDNPISYTLCLRQQDVKQDWHIELNGRKLGKLVVDEKDMFRYVEVPAHTLIAGTNTLFISTAASEVDDIAVSQLHLVQKPLNQFLNEASLQVEVADKESGQGLPARITITNTERTLQPIQGGPGQQLAVRPGYVYTGTGGAALGLPAGTYRIYASRGMEYGVDSADVVLQPGSQVRQQLRISREVPTSGWISSDTHVHTYTYSGHGDASIGERALTLAGEGVELPIITDHNVIVDIRPWVREMGVDKFFTPVSGIEVTTPVGHFNVWPVKAGAALPNAKVKDWNSLGRELGQVPGLEAIILNHARDVHGGFRPFDPQQHLAVAGRSLTGWQLPANAMEIINSGALQTDNLQLYHDWMGMLNGGQQLTPVGSSDSHDVTRYVVGQARTYIRSQDQQPGQLDAASAAASFKAGKVMVGFGLLAEITVNNQYGPGDLVPASGEVQVTVRVLGPAWARAGKVSLFANGRKVQQALIRDPGTGGVKWQGTWKLPRSGQDLFLTALAEGPAGAMPFWPIGKPYQPLSPDWEPRVLGMSGAVRVDGDGDQQFSAARDYARDLVEKYAGKLPQLFKKLQAYDESVALQVASELQQRGMDVSGPELKALLKKASPATKAGFAHFIAAKNSSSL